MTVHRTAACLSMHYGVSAAGLRTRFPRAAALLEDAVEDILAYRHLPLEHQRQLHSTNPLERLNTEIKRRSNVVGIFPNPAAVIRLVGAILLEPGRGGRRPDGARQWFAYAPRPGPLVTLVAAAARLIAGFPALFGFGQTTSRE